MKRRTAITVMLAGLVLLILIACSTAGATRTPFVGNTYCHDGVTVTSTSPLQEELLSDGAAYPNGFWSRRNGRAYENQTPSELEIRVHHLFFTHITVGPCTPVVDIVITDVDSSPMCAYLNGAIPTMVTVAEILSPASDGGRGLANGWMPAHFFAGNVEGGTNIGAFHAECLQGTPTGLWSDDSGWVSNAPNTAYANPIDS